MRKKYELQEGFPSDADHKAYMRLYNEKHKERLQTQRKDRIKQLVSNDPNYWKKKHNKKERHVTGKYRALLCSTCNKGLGIFEKNHKLYEAYLRKFK